MTSPLSTSKDISCVYARKLSHRYQKKKTLYTLNIKYYIKHRARQRMFLTINSNFSASCQRIIIIIIAFFSPGLRSFSRYPSAEEIFLKKKKIASGRRHQS